MAMSRDQDDFQRARRPEQKRQREAAILEAALKLAQREGIRNISLSDIAGEVGMHKTALLRYFETREDIYLQLAIDAWRDWADSLGDELRSLAAGDVNSAAQAFGHTLSERPFLCDLFTHLPLNLERNVSTTALFGFKLAAHTATVTLARALHAPLPDVSEEDRADLVAAVTAIAGLLWQVVHPPQAVLDLYAENPTIAHPYNDFIATVARFAETFILGVQARTTR
jgi:AcrR family transcriptional regulator